MRGRWRELLRRFCPRLAAFETLVLNGKSYLHTVGWMTSLQRGFPYGKDGLPVPWMNYSAVAFLEQRLRREHVVFEYGSGHSTLFFARLTGSVTSVEYDRKWYETMQRRIPANVSLIFQAQDRDGEYCRSIKATGRRYDVVIVDGRDRVNCIKQSVDCLTAGGAILLDDSCRTSYAPGLEYARGEGFRTLDLEGMKPMGNEMERATVIYRDGNCLGI